MQETAEQRGGKWARIVFLSTLLVGVVSIVGYAAQGNYVAFLRMASLGSLVAISGWGIGGLLGFLFGIPRTLQKSAQDSSDEASVPEAEETSRVVADYRGNTNLEQISDWLTKILVGVTLTQFRSIQRELGAVIDFLAPAFNIGDPYRGKIFAAGLIIIFRFSVSFWAT